MIICICNNISEQDLEQDPTLEIGTQCGICLIFNETEDEDK